MILQAQQTGQIGQMLVHRIRVLTGLQQGQKDRVHLWPALREGIGEWHPFGDKPRHTVQLPSGFRAHRPLRQDAQHVDDRKTHAEHDRHLFGQRRLIAQGQMAAPKGHFALPPRNGRGRRSFAQIDNRQAKRAQGVIGGGFRWA